MLNKFAATIDAYDDHGEGDQLVINGETICEVVGFNKDGTVVVGFNDRNERGYLTFSVAGLMNAIAHFRGET